MANFVVTAPGTIMHDIVAAYELGKMPEISSIGPDWEDALTNRPVGSDPVTLLIISFAAQFGATVTAEIVKKYLIDRSGRIDSEENIEVHKKETDDEK